MYAPGIAGNLDRPEPPSFGGIFSTANRDDVVAFLGEIKFTGWIGPVQGLWILIVAENPLGQVAAARRTLDQTAKELAARTRSLTMSAAVSKDTSLRLGLYDGEERIAHLDTNPAEDEGGFAVNEFGEPVGPESGSDAESGFMLDEFGEPMVDEFGEPIGAMMMDDAEDDEFVHAPIARAFGRPDLAEELTELLEESLSEDQSESERMTSLARMLDLPTWLVSSASLPKRIWGAPDPSEMTRLRAGRQGLSGAVLGSAVRRLRR